MLSHFQFLLYDIFLMFLKIIFHCVSLLNNYFMLYFKFYMNVTGATFNLFNPRPFQFENNVN